MNLRLATMDDAEILLAWRNDPLTRAMSHNTQELSLGEHLKWLGKTLSNTSRRLYIAEVNGIPIGTVRADIGDTTELSWTVAPEYRRRGYGKQMVCLASKLHWPVRAEIKPNNSASAKIAEAAGMTCSSVTPELLYYS